MTNQRDDGRPDEDVWALAELTESITRRLEAGEPVTGDDLGDDPACAGPVRQLLPTLRTILSLGEEVIGEEGARTRLRKKNEGPLSSFPDSNPDVQEVGP